MTTASSASPSAFGGLTAWLRRAESWLDARGRWAWIATLILAFMVFWPLGIALLAYLIWGKRMGVRSGCGQNRYDHSHSTHWTGSSGNAAFDAYKSDMLRRLESEQQAFEAFLQRLRDAKDKSEFDTFMEERARVATAPRDDVPGEAA